MYANKQIEASDTSGQRRLLTSFRSGLPWSVHRNFDGLRIGGYLRWARRYRYGYGETFTYLPAAEEDEKTENF